MKHINIRSLGWNYEIDSKTNIGDSIQLLAIDYLYKEMGKKNVTYLNIKDISAYQGEKLILPINQMIGRGDPWLDEEGNFALSEDIEPVFLGVCLREGFFPYTDYNLEYLKKYAPIGCRDYYTFKQMKNYNIPAYMAGCLTMTFPKREVSIKKYRKVFLVDVPSEVKKYIPNNILRKSETIHHTVSMNQQEYQDASFLRRTATNFLKKYWREANLVVTSRLHCAVPCIAMGIPVIIARQYRGYTFDWIQKFIKFYSEEEYQDICWKPNPLEIEDYKRMAQRVAMERLKGNNVQEDIDKLNNFYMENYTDDYMPEEMSLMHFKLELEKRYDREDRFDYAIWGISKMAEHIYEYLSENYKNARLVKVFDSFAQKIFHDIISENPCVLKKKDSFVTIVTTINCMDSGAKPLFEKLGKEEIQYIYAADSFL